MRTACAFAFISYNSRDFLQKTLNTFIEAKLFLRCACWYHKSAGNEKSHFHCWVEPAVQIDTAIIADKFIELTEDGKQQSIAIRPRCKSDFINAYLYGIHDSVYLDYKGLEREQVNIQTNQHIYLGDFTVEILEAEDFCFQRCLAPYARLKELVEQGLTLEAVYIKLRTPFAFLYPVKVAYNNIVEKITLKTNIENEDNK